MRLTTGILALLAMLLFATAAAKEKDKDPDPTFAPGAQVSIELTVRAPRGWQLNYLLPITAIFDEKQLKDAPFTIEEPTLSFKLKEYTPDAVVTIPVELKRDATPGELSVPFALDYSVCEIETEACTFNVEDVEVRVQVEDSAPKGSKNRALGAGSLQATVQLPPAPA